MVFVGLSQREKHSSFSLRPPKRIVENSFGPFGNFFFKQRKRPIMKSNHSLAASLLALILLSLFKASGFAATTGPQLNSFLSNTVYYATVSWRDRESNLLTRVEVTVDAKAWF